jgi:hypothetical protein
MQHACYLLTIVALLSMFVLFFRCFRPFQTGIGFADADDKVSVVI